MRRPGAPDTFTAEQRVALLALSCEPPALSGRPVSHWTPGELAAEAIQARADPRDLADVLPGKLDQMRA